MSTQYMDSYCSTSLQKMVWHLNCYHFTLSPITADYAHFRIKGCLVSLWIMFQLVPIICIFLFRTCVFTSVDTTSHALTQTARMLLIYIWPFHDRWRWQAGEGVGLHGRGSNPHRDSSWWQYYQHQDLLQQQDPSQHQRRWSHSPMEVPPPSFLLMWHVESWTLEPTDKFNSVTPHTCSITSNIIP